MRQKAAFKRGNRKNKMNEIKRFNRGLKKALSLMLCIMILLSGMDSTVFAKAKTLPYENIERFSNGLAMVCRNGKYGFVDTKGKEIVKPKYTAAQPFSDGVARVC